MGLGVVARNTVLSLAIVLGGCSQKPIFQDIPIDTTKEININSQEDVISYILSYDKSKIIPFITDDFSDGPGAVVSATREEGLEAMVEKARNDELGSSWIYISDHNLWINDILYAEAAKETQDVKLLEYLTNITSNIEVWHTHLDAACKDYYSPEQFTDFGNSIYFIPSEEDVYSHMFNQNQNPTLQLKTVIASGEGALYMKGGLTDFVLNNIYSQKAFDDYCALEFVFIREHVRGTSVDSLEIKAEQYSRNLELEFQRVER